MESDKQDDPKKPPRPEAPATDSAFAFEQIIDGILDADPKAVEQHHTRRKRRLKRRKANKK